jgi:nitrite reductase/ring-hydroxylating ferredoxin subunit
VAFTINALLERAIARLERAAQLDPVADRAANVLTKALSARPVRTALSGTQIGHSLHPALISLPIGSWLAALYLDLAGTEEDGAAAQRLIGLGLAAAGPAALTGANDWAYTTGAERRVGFVHAVTNYLGIGLFSASWAARRRGHRATGMVTAGCGAAAIAAAGWLGGHLSYARGVGVDTTAFQVAPTDWTEVLQEDQLPDETPTLVHADGVPILLIRHDGTLLALADRCSHRGAPLHEGCVSNAEIECPWHKSRFSLQTGAVLAGPATRPQARYETRTRYGSIQVRRTDEPGSLRSNPVS